MRSISALAMALLMLVGTSICAAVEPVAIGQSAPGFSLQDQDGKTVNLADFPGKIVVLEWTNPECPFVIRHYNAKTMTTLANDYKDRNVVWLAINSSRNCTNEANKQWAGQNQVSYPILNDASGQTGVAYGARTTPDMFVISADGKLAYTGAIDNDPRGEKADKINYVRQALDEIIAGKPVSIPQTKSYGCSVKYAK